MLPGAGKKTLGRKRHLIVDALGLVLAVVVYGVDIQDCHGGDELLLKLVNRFTRLEVIWADGGYAGSFVKEAKLIYDRVIEIVKRSDDVKDFKVLPKRWIVERTFAWLGKYRRLSKDYEDLVHSSETMIRLAMTNFMIHRLLPR